MCVFFLICLSFFSIVFYYIVYVGLPTGADWRIQ